MYPQPPNLVNKHHSAKAGEALCVPDSSTSLLLSLAPPC